MADHAPAASTLTIKVPDGVPQNATILLNGERIPGLCALRLDITPDLLVRAVLTVEVAVDAELAVVERILESLPPPA